MADMFGGQGTGQVKLCLDCKFRPPRWSHTVGGPGPCERRPELGVLDARDACKGADWVLRGT